MGRKLAILCLCLLLPLPLFGQNEKEGAKKPQKSAEELVSQLSAGDWRLREDAQKKLLALGEEAAEALEEALDDENFEVRYRARLLSDSIGARARAVKLLAYLTGEKEAEKSLDVIKKKVNNPMARLTSPKDGVRALLARELGDTELESGLPLLVHLLGDENQAVQGNALQSLGLFEGEKRRKLLLVAAEKGELLLKCRAILALGKLQDTEAIDEVAKHLDSDILYLRLAAVESLDAMRDCKALEKIVKAFGDEYERPRWNAVDAFNRTKCKAGMKDLIGAFGREVARIMDEEELATIKKVLVPAGFSILKGEEAQMKRYIAKALSYQTGMNFGDDADKWREWWEKNEELFDNQMNRAAPDAKKGE